MKRKLLFLAALVAGALGFNANAKDDVTNLVTNADLSSNPSSTGWTTVPAAHVTDWATATDGDHVNVVEFYAGDNDLKNAGNKFKIYQSAKLPKGYYHLAINAFYRNGGSGDGTNDGIAWIFAGEKTQNVYALNAGELNEFAGGGMSGGSGDLQKAANAFHKGEFLNEFDFQVTTDGETEIGFEGANFTGFSWCILGPVTLWQYEASDYIADYKALVANAEALYGSKMNATVLAALQEAAGKEEGELSDIDDAYNAVEALKVAIAEANKSIAIYAATKAALDAYDAKAASLDKFGQAAYDVADIKTAYENGTMEEDQTDDIVAIFAAATKVQVAAGADYTGAIVNPEINGFDGWSEERPYGGNGPLLDNIKMEYWGGGNYTEGGTRENASFDYYQVIEGLTNGKYTVSAEMANSRNGITTDELTPTCGVYAKAGETEVYALADVDDGDNSVLKEYTTEEIEVTDGTLRIGVKSVIVPIAARWFVADNFKLTLVEVTMPELTNPAFDANEEDVVSENLNGYQKDATDKGGVAGLQPVDNWTRSSETPNTTENKSGSGWAGGVFAYGSENTINDKITAPAAGPEGNTDGVALAIVGVWSGTAQYTQEVKLPAGNYVLTYDVYNGVNTGAVTKNLFGFIADDAEYLSTQNSFAAVGEWQKIYVPFTLNKETTGKISVGYTAQNAGSGVLPFLFVDNVSYAVVSDEELAVAQAKAAKIAELNTKTITGEIANYSVDKKLAAVAAAETVEDVEAVLAPTYIFTLTTSEGLQLNTEDGIKIEEKGTPLSLTVQTNGAYALSPNEGEYINYTGNNTWTLGTNSTAYGWTVALADGKYTITGKGSNNENKLGTDDTAAGSICYGNKNNANIYWTIAEYAPTVTVTEALYATYVTAEDVEFGDEVEAYVVSGLNEDNTVATLKPITEAPAGTPVVIKADEAGTYKLNVIGKAKEVGENLLEVATGEETGEGIYVLADINEVVGFYALEEGVTVPAGKAYLKVDAANGIKFIGFEGNGGATGIQGVEDNAAAEAENGAIYNLAGQRVQNPTKGIYIVNGKKVLVK